MSDLNFGDESFRCTWIPLVQWFYWDVIPKNDDQDVGGALVAVTIVGDGPYTAALSVQRAAQLATSPRPVPVPEKSALFDDLALAKTTSERWVAERIEQLRYELSDGMAEA
jgi:hypothetical protein